VLSVLTLAPLVIAAAATATPAYQPIERDQPQTVASTQDSIPRPASLSAEENRTRLRAEIESILQRPEFRLSRLTQERETPAWLRWLRERWRRLNETLSGLTWLPAGASPWFLPVISALLGLAVLYMVYRIARESLFAGGTPPREALAPGVATHELMKRASVAAEKGDYAEAIRLVFTATLLYLFPREGPQTPTRTLVRTLEAESPVRSHDLSGLNGLFEVHFYGSRPASASGYRQALSLSGRLTKTMRGGSGEPVS